MSLTKNLTKDFKEFGRNAIVFLIITLLGMTFIGGIGYLVSWQERLDAARDAANTITWTAPVTIIPEGVNMTEYLDQREISKFNNLTLEEQQLIVDNGKFAACAYVQNYCKGNTNSPGCNKYCENWI